VEVFVSQWRYMKQYVKYLHRFWTDVEHEFAPGGGSGDSGGISLFSWFLVGQMRMDLSNTMKLAPCLYLHEYRLAPQS